MFFNSAGSISETIFIQSTQNFAHFLLDLFIINKIKIFVFLQRELLHAVIINKIFILLMMNKSNKIKSMRSDPMRDSFLALRDSCRDSGRDWIPILFFLARDFN